MLSLTPLSLLIPLSTSFVIKAIQKPLLPPQTTLTPSLSNISIPTVERFPIEDMSDTAFHVHHAATKHLLGERAYLLLRKAELESREDEIWNWIWENDLDCGNWADEGLDDYEYQPRIWLSDNRVFNVDPNVVPQHIITGIEDLATQEWKTRLEMRQSSYCSEDPYDNSKDGEKSSKSNLEAAEPAWKVVVPDEYLVYQIPASVLDQEMGKEQEVWEARAENKKQDILAGRLSVRDMKVPDLTKCEMLAAHDREKGY
ncbi:hypothetical protein E4T43_02047 [Aureobasidium subglaciale]|nr:hypothetical protein E4T43_02047 [Aureobasidium subglaciale]